MTCQNCNRCTAINKKVIDLFNTGELPDYRYLCKRCQITFPSITNINDKINKTSERQEGRMRSLEQKVSKLEEDNTLFNKSVDGVEKKIMGNIEDKIINNNMDTVDKRYNEFQDRKKR